MSRFPLTRVRAAPPRVLQITCLGAADGGHAICDMCVHGFLLQTSDELLRQHFGVLSTRRRRCARSARMIRAANEIDDLQRGIRLAFSVPETHVASAIGYLVGDGPAAGKFSDEVALMFESLATPAGWALCADLLKIRLQLRAGKLRQTRDVDAFYRLLKRKRC